MPAAVVLRLGLWLVLVLLLPTQKVWDGPGTSMHWMTMFGAGSGPVSTASVLLFMAVITGAGEQATAAS